MRLLVREKLDQWLGSTFHGVWTGQLIQHFFCVGWTIIPLWLGRQSLVSKTGCIAWRWGWESGRRGFKKRVLPTP